MKAENIGKNAGIVWRTLYHNETEMTFRELVQATQLSEIDVAAAIGWLSREYKIRLDETENEQLFSVFRECYY
jgi:DNA-binding transcriptional regulator GbsR (MarR family)